MTDYRTICKLSRIQQTQHILMRRNHIHKKDGKNYLVKL